jgi:hypothetical protein
MGSREVYVQARDERFLSRIRAERLALATVNGQLPSSAILHALTPEAIRLWAEQLSSEISHPDSLPLVRIVNEIGQRLDISADSSREMHPDYGGERATAVDHLMDGLIKQCAILQRSYKPT